MSQVGGGNEPPAMRPWDHVDADVFEFKWNSAKQRKVNIGSTRYDIAEVGQASFIIGIWITRHSNYRFHAEMLARSRWHWCPIDRPLIGSSSRQTKPRQCLDHGRSVLNREPGCVAQASRGILIPELDAYA
jgi:hypothetical protein